MLHWGAVSSEARGQLVFSPWGAFSHPLGELLCAVDRTVAVLVGSVEPSVAWEAGMPRVGWLRHRHARIARRGTKLRVVSSTGREVAGLHRRSCGRLVLVELSKAHLSAG